VDGVPIERFAGILAVAALVLGGCGSSSGDDSTATADSPSAAKLRTVTVHVGKEKVTAEVARTGAERRQGLSGRASLAENRGMLFVFGDRAQRTFWMKGMRFPLDIVWIARGRVTGFAPDASVPTGEPPLYPSTGPADRVLEVPAGWMARHRLGVGARVRVGG
jgi:uncharacterized membrane protein (UPF0127 family)